MLSKADLGGPLFHPNVGVGSRGLWSHWELVARALLAQYQGKVAAARPYCQLASDPSWAILACGQGRLLTITLMNLSCLQDWVAPQGRGVKPQFWLQTFQARRGGVVGVERQQAQAATGWARAASVLPSSLPPTAKSVGRRHLLGPDSAYALPLTEQPPSYLEGIDYELWAQRYSL